MNVTSRACVGSFQRPVRRIYFLAFLSFYRLLQSPWLIDPSTFIASKGQLNFSGSHISLTLTLLLLSFIYEDPCDYIGSIQKIQSAILVPPLLHNIITGSQDQDPDIFLGDRDYFAYHRNHSRRKIIILTPLSPKCRQLLWNG